jgi:hypothetical protein
MRICGTFRPVLTKAEIQIKSIDKNEKYHHQVRHRANRTSIPVAKPCNKPTTSPELMTKSLTNEATLSYLRLLISSSSHSSTISSSSTLSDDEELISRLFQSLEVDGYHCQHESRQLSDQLTPSDSAFVTYIILVMLCILCAAAANGLTQVSLSHTQ